MKILAESVNLVYKILPLTLSEDGAAHVTVTKCVEHLDGQLEPISSQVVQFTTAEVDVVLDIAPTPTLTRRQDIGLMVYKMLLNKGAVSGTLQPV